MPRMRRLLQSVSLLKKIDVRVLLAGCLAFHSAATAQPANEPQTNVSLNTAYETYKGTLQFPSFGLTINAYSGKINFAYPDAPRIDGAGLPLQALHNNFDVIDLSRFALLNGPGNTQLRDRIGIVPRVSGAVFCKGYGALYLNEGDYEYDGSSQQNDDDIDTFRGMWLDHPGVGKPVQLSPIKTAGTFFPAEADYGSKEYFYAVCDGDLPSNYELESGADVQNPTDAMVAMDVVAPNGARYTFEREPGGGSNWHKRFGDGDGWLRATRAVDVSGRALTYQYDSASPYLLNRIVADDGRAMDVSVDYESIDLSYGNRNWAVQGTMVAGSKVVTFTRPDGKQWKFEYTGFLADDEFNREHWNKAHYCDDSVSTITITNPAGGTMTLTVKMILVWAPDDYVRFHYNGIPPKSAYTCGNNRDFIPGHSARTFAGLSVHPGATAIEISDPQSSGTYSYTIEYEEAWGRAISGQYPLGELFLLDRKVTFPDLTTATYTYNSDGEARHIVNNSDGEARHIGDLVKEEVFNEHGQSVMEYTPTYHRLRAGVHLSGYPRIRGVDWRSSPGSYEQYDSVIKKKEYKLSGDTYTTEYDYADGVATPSYSYAAPVEVRRWSSVSGGVQNQRITQTQYDLPNLSAGVIGPGAGDARWVIGQPLTIHRNNKLFDEYEYDSKGRMTRHERFGHLWETFGYHASGSSIGELAWAEDALSRRTSYSDYYRGLPRTTTYADLSTSHRTVDANGWVTSETNGRGVTTGYEYNSVGWLTKIDRPAPWSDTVIAYSWPGNGLVQTSTRGGARTTTTYDNLVRPVLVKTEVLSGNGLTTYVKTDYDAFGRVTFSSYPSTSSTSAVGIETAYDVLGRVIETRETTAPFATTTTAYLSGNRTRVTDPLGYSTTTTLRAYGSPDNGDVVRIEQPEGVTTDMTYDDWGNVLTATQGGGGLSHTQRYVYDSRLRLCRHSVPETGDTLYDYDIADQMTHVARGQAAGTTCPTSMPSGDTIVRTYDALGRVDIVNYPGVTPDIDFDYDANGNVTRNARGSAVWDYVYDTADNLTAETLSIDGRTYATTYEYNATGGLLSNTTPAGREVTFAPNWFGQPNRAGIPGYNYAIGFTYHPDGSVAGFTYGNGQALTRSLNARQLVDGITVAKAGGATAVDLTYAYDANGRIIEKNDRATPVFAGPPTPRTVEAQYDSNNRLWRFRDTLEDNAWQLVYYDARGNVRDTGTIAYGGLDIFYDTAEQPRSIGGAVTASFVYDGNLKRVKQTINGEIIYSVYSQSGALLYRDNATTGETTDYIRANGMTLARLRGGVTTFPHADHLGSPVSATDAGGNVLWREQYTAFGEKRLDPALNFDNQGFTGHVDDAATGLTYMQARYYDPVLGRFLSNDPVAFSVNQPQMFNRYSYCLNDPTNCVDPDGRVGKAVRFLRNLKKADGNPIKAGAETIAGIADNIGTLTDGQLTGDDVTAAIDLVSGLDKKDQAAIKGAAKQLRRPYIRKGTRQQVEDNAPRTPDGRPIDPNTGSPIDGKPDMGHKPGREFRKEKANAEAQGMSQKEFNDQQNDPDIYQLEDPSSNRSHRFEEPD